MELKQNEFFMNKKVIEKDVSIESWSMIKNIKMCIRR